MKERRKKFGGRIERERWRERREKAQGGGSRMSECARVWSIGSKQGHHPSEAHDWHFKSYPIAYNVHMHAAFYAACMVNACCWSMWSI